MNVEKGGQAIILINDGSWGLSVHNLAEDAISHGYSFLEECAHYIKVSRQQKRPEENVRPFL
jgi:hypothetical protein